MTDTSISTLSAAPVGMPRVAASAADPQPAHRGPLLLLWLCVWLPMLPAALLLGRPLLPQPLAWGWLPTPVAALAGLGVGLLASLLLLARVARPAAPGQPPLEAVSVPDAPVAAMPAPPEADSASPAEAVVSPEAAAAPPRPAAGTERADARVTLQLHQQQIGDAIGEAARRTIALCGMLDSDMQDAERAQADVEAIQDEERNALQLMAALRSRLLVLVQHCQSLAEAARTAARSSAAPADAIDALAAAAAAELTQCHQLSERIGGAERMNERRIDSMRRSTDRLLCRAERGMHEAQQLMVLTRQVQAAQAASLQQLEQIAAFEP